jgi:hypothetical protein
MDDNGLYVRRNLIVPANALSTRPVHKVVSGLSAIGRTPATLVLPAYFPTFTPLAPGATVRRIWEIFAASFVGSDALNGRLHFKWPVASEIGAVLRRRVSWGPSTVGESSTIAYGAAGLTVGPTARLKSGPFPKKSPEMPTASKPPTPSLHSRTRECRGLLVRVHGRSV